MVRLTAHIYLNRRCEVRCLFAKKEALEKRKQKWFFWRKFYQYVSCLLCFLATQPMDWGSLSMYNHTHFSLYLLSDAPPFLLPLLPSLPRRPAALDWSGPATLV